MFRLQVLESVGSTNEVIKRAIENGEPEGLAIRAYCQTGGYGRQGRTWKSPRGGMYESILLRPKVDMRELPTLALVVALAVRRALAGLVARNEARRISIKWPNDVVLVEEGAAVSAGGRGAPCSNSPALENSPLGRPLGREKRLSTARRAVDRAELRAEPPARRQTRDGTPSVKNLYSKLAGISSEVHAGGVCVGIGVNVEPPREHMEVSGKNAPAYLTDLGFGFTCEHEAAVNEVGDAVLAAFEPLYTAWCEGGFSALAAEFAEHSMLEGRFVRMANQVGDVVHEGTVQGVDAAGRLLLANGQGSTIAVASGEVHLL